MHQRVGGVGLVDDDELGHLAGADLGEHLAHGGDLALGVGVRAVDDVHDQVGVGDLLQRRAERLDELVGQVADEPDGVGERVDPPVLGRRTTRGGVERGEQRVLDEHAGVGQPVEQRGLAGVGVAGDRHRRDRVALALGPLGVAGGAHVAQLGAQLGDLGVDPAAVGLDLGLTGTTATDAAALRADAATGLAGEVATPAAQPLLHVAELGQLDLGLALTRLRVLGEDVEDQRGPVDDLDLDLVLEVAQLAGGELAVADDGVGAGVLDDLVERLDLAAADERRRVGLLPALVDRLQHLGAGRLGERRELGQGVLGVLGGALGPDADEHDALEPELAVLDLGDVLELGAQAADALERVAGLEVPVAVGLLGVVAVAESRVAELVGRRRRPSRRRRSVGLVQLVVVPGGRRGRAARFLRVVMCLLCLRPRVARGTTSGEPITFRDQHRGAGQQDASLLGPGRPRGARPARPRRTSTPVRPRRRGRWRP